MIISFDFYYQPGEVEESEALLVEVVEVHDKWGLTSNYPYYPLTTRG